MLRPTIFISVPRLFNKFYSLIKKKNDHPKNGEFSSILGGKIRLLVSASAPISDDVKDFMKKAIGAPMIEGYGCTENSGPATITDMNDTTSNHVGIVAVNLEFKLIDIPEMNYMVTNVDEEGRKMPSGELLLRGYGIIPGYYKMEEKTKEAIDEDGWYHTGDVGQILPSGTIKIIDRKKNLFKLSQGVYVAPEKIENIYIKISYIAEAFIFGDPL